MTQGYISRVPTTPLTVPNGGTGAATLTGVLTGNGTSPVTGAAVTQYGVLVGGASNVVDSTAVGTAAQVLTSNGAGVAPTFQAAAGGGGGMVFLASATGSTSATLEFSSSIDSTYNEYLFLLTDITTDHATNSGTLRLRTSTDGGSTYDSTSDDYDYVMMLSRSGISTASAQSNDNSATYMALSVNAIVNSSGEALNAWVRLFNPAGTNFTHAIIDSSCMSSAYLYTATGAGIRRALEDVDAVQFSWSASNIESGTISMYGITTPS